MCIIIEDGLSSLLHKIDRNEEIKTHATLFVCMLSTLEKKL